MRMRISSYEPKVNYYQKQATAGFAIYRDDDNAY